MAATGVETQAFKTHPTEASGTCLCLVTPDSQRTMRTYLGAAATLDPAEIGAADFAGCTHAHIEGYLLFNESLMRHVLKTAKAAGCTVSLDLASPEVVGAARAILPDLIREHVNMVFANEDEAAAFAGTRDEGEALRCLARLCRLAVVKVGVRGSLIRRGEETVTVPARRVKAVDTTGAGDLWAAGFLYGVLTGRSLADAGRFGSVVAAAVVQQTGAVIPEGKWCKVRAELGLGPGCGSHVK